MNKKNNGELIINTPNKKEEVFIDHYAIVAFSVFEHWATNQFKSQHRQVAAIGFLSKTLNFNCSVVSCLNCKSLWIKPSVRGDQCKI